MVIGIRNIKVSGSIKSYSARGSQLGICRRTAIARETAPAIPGNAR